MPSSGCTLRRLYAPSADEIDQLTDVLLDCVAGGASVSFMAPLIRERAAAFWTRIAADVMAGDRLLVIAEDGEGVCGTVQLVLNLPENQPHRADVAKMLVHRRARRRGVGAALIEAAEIAARECGRSLLVLDTVTGGDAERMYLRAGWQKVGVIPRYALFPEGGFCATTVFFKDLSPP